MARGAFSAMKHHWYRADGKDGWVFSIDAEGRVADARRDLYAHAFIIYAAAWLYRLTGDAECLTTADDTLAAIDSLFAAEGGGYVSEVGKSGDERQQNPHMHLLEAVLLLFEAGGRAQDLARADVLVQMFSDRLRSATSGTVLEQFDTQWRPVKPAGQNPVEPGHQFEWIWLLREYERLAGKPQDAAVRVLRDFALAHGCDIGAGRVYNVVLESGPVVAADSRTWPHTEALRALLLERARGNYNDEAFLTALLSRLRDVHLPDRLAGGWHDKVDIHDAPLGGPMPASTLYHAAGAVFDGAPFVTDAD
jgi:mannose-6-phosphate isomerase